MFSTRKAAIIYVLLSTLVTTILTFIAGWLDDLGHWLSEPLEVSIFWLVIALVLLSILLFPNGLDD